MSAQPKCDAGPAELTIRRVIGDDGHPASRCTYPLDVIEPDSFYGSMGSGLSSRATSRLQEYLGHPSVGILFSRMTEGRPYSIASRLRELGFAGEIHALGLVHPEVVHHMVRVGFTHFHMDPEIESLDPHILRPFSFSYQRSLDQ